MDETSTSMPVAWGVPVESWRPFAAATCPWAGCKTQHCHARHASQRWDLYPNPRASLDLVGLLALTFARYVFDIATSEPNLSRP